MEGKEFDCNCPQYVDFLAGLSGEGDSFFGETGGTPKLYSSREDRTPCKDLNSLKENHYQANSELEILNQSSAIRALHLVTPLRRRSKSVSNMHIKCTERVFKMPGRQRSSSTNDLRPRRKVTYATTPMCLKRTLAKSKNKKIKTTEEMELEKIAQLQKQLSDHLRLNEKSLKKLNLKAKATIPRNMLQVLESNAKGARKKTMKSTVPLAEVIETVTNNMRSKFVNRQLKLNERSVPSQMNIWNKSVKTKETSCVINKFTKATQSKFEEACSSKLAEKEAKLLSKRPLPFKYGFHSGLTLVQNPKKITVVKPFYVDKAKLIDEKKGSKMEFLFSNSLITPQIKKSDKENVLLGLMTSFSEVKVVKNNNIIGNSQQMLSSSQYIHKRGINPLKERNKV